MCVYIFSYRIYHTRKNNKIRRSNTFCGRKRQSDTQIGPLGLNVNFHRQKYSRTPPLPSPDRLSRISPQPSNPFPPFSCSHGPQGSRDERRRKEREGGREGRCRRRRRFETVGEMGGRGEILHLTRRSYTHPGRHTDLTAATWGIILLFRGESLHPK